MGITAPSGYKMPVFLSTSFLMEEIEQAFVTCKAFSLEKAILWTEDMYFVQKKRLEVKILNDRFV